MESSDQIQGSKTLNDVMYRRLKNRERQRRYRERKRLRADAGKTCGTDHSSQLQIVPLQVVPLLTNGTVEQVVTRVHCTRDWKKDARRVHTAKQGATCNAYPNSQSLAAENHSCGVQEPEQTLKSEVPSTNSSRPDDHDKFRSKRGRRDWKAEARNKNLRSSSLSVTQSRR